MTVLTDSGSKEQLLSDNFSLPSLVSSDLVCSWTPLSLWLWLWLCRCYGEKSQTLNCGDLWADLKPAGGVFLCVYFLKSRKAKKKKISRSEKPFPGDSVSSNWWLLVIIHSLLDVSWLPGEPISAALASGLADDVSNDVIALHNSPLHIKIWICSVQRIMYVDTVVLKGVGGGARRQYSSPWRTGYNSAVWTLL